MIPVSPISTLQVPQLVIFPTKQFSWQFSNNCDHCKYQVPMNKTQKQQFNTKCPQCLKHDNEGSESSETRFGFSRPRLVFYQSQYWDRDWNNHRLNNKTKTMTEILSVFISRQRLQKNWDSIFGSQTRDWDWHQKFIW